MDGEEILVKLNLEKADANIAQSSYEKRKASRYEHESTSSLLDNKGSSRYTNTSMLRKR